MPIFLSTFVNKLDKKGRISVPATFRSSLAQQSFQGIVAYPSFTAAAIEGCGMDFMEDMVSKTDGLAAFSEEQDALTALIFSDAHRLAWDGEGRIVLPEELIAHAGLTTAAAFVGKGKTFQIWEPDALRAVKAELRQRALSSRLTLPPRLPVEGG